MRKNRERQKELIQKQVWSDNPIFSEVYADSQAIYLTMEAKSEEPFPDTMMSQDENGEMPVLSMNYTRDYDIFKRTAGGL